jgi:predicted ferric reductase
MNPVSRKSLLGWTAIILISLIPVFLFFVLGNGASGFNDFSSSLYTLGRIFALIGITLFTLNFILSTRLKFLEEIFGGLDKAYLVHGIVGGIAFMFILAHPIFLVANLIPAHLVQAANYFIPGGIFALDFGLIAIVGLITLIFVTFFTRMKYNHWKLTHEFMGGIFGLVILHMLTVDDIAIDNIFIGYKIFVLVIALIGGSAIVYSWIIRKKYKKYPMYKVASVNINKNIIELQLEPESESLQYQSGQFLFLRFYNEKLSKEPHPFSIASKSNEKTIKVAIKESGDFTRELVNLKIGDRVSIEGPYGKFNFKNFDNKEQIWIAGGIGITPFLGMIDELKENPDFDITLLYIFRENYIITKKFAEEISKIKNLRFITWNSEKKGEISIGKIIGENIILKDKEILICGPSGMKESLIKGLKELKISRNKVHEEVFDLK